MYADCIYTYTAARSSPLRAPGFPSTAVVQQQNEEADDMQKVKRDKQRKEAESVH